MYGPWYERGYIYKIDSWGSLYFIFRKQIDGKDNLWYAISKPFQREGSAITIVGKAAKAGMNVEDYMDKKRISWNKCRIKT